MWLLLCLALIVLDQIAKWATVEWVAPVGSIPLIENVFHLSYVQNTGVAFGMLQGRFWLFTIVVVLATIGILWYFFAKTTADQKWMRLSLVMILAGALGNYIDRIFRGFVVDTFDFRWIGFWVFNLADTWITIGCVLLLLYVLLVADRPKEGIQ